MVAQGDPPKSVEQALLREPHLLHRATRICPGRSDYDTVTTRGSAPGYPAAKVGLNGHHPNGCSRNYSLSSYLRYGTETELYYSGAYPLRYQSLAAPLTRWRPLPVPPATPPPSPPSAGEHRDCRRWACRDSGPGTASPSAAGSPSGMGWGAPGDLKESRRQWSTVGILLRRCLLP